MRVLAGPPGTGKTWQAARDAVRILRPETPAAQVPEVHKDLVEQGLIIWVTFHPSFTYEDFVEGFRPEETESGNVTYSIVPGPFLRACRVASAAVSPSRFHLGQTLGPRDQYIVTEVEAGGLVLQTIANRRLDAVQGEDDEPARAFVDFWTIKRFIDAGLTPAAMRVPGKQNERKQEIARLVGVPTTFLANSGRHAAVWESLQSEHVTVEPTPAVLVIDEINRADLSRVFGELITLLELDKRQGADEERRVQLTYSGTPFTVPATLSVLGTMNTADRSLSTVDLALRRRFEFVLIEPDPMLVDERWGGVNLRALFVRLNRRLSALNGRENLLGHADFMRVKLEEVRVRNGWASGPEGELRTLATVLRRKTLPLLVDIFKGEHSRLRFVLGSAFFIEDNLDDLRDDLSSLMDYEPEPSWEAAAWWDPFTNAWDSQHFLQACSAPSAVA